MASAVGAPTGRRLRGGCEVGSWGEGIQCLDDRVVLQVYRQLAM